MKTVAQITALVLILGMTPLILTGAPAKKSEVTVEIVKTSLSLEVAAFLLREGRVDLKSSKDFHFYAEIRAKNVRGKKRQPDYSRTRRRGKQYTVVYTYEYLPSGKKTRYKHRYIVWQDGEIYNWKPSERIHVGSVTMETRYTPN